VNQLRVHAGGRTLKKKKEKEKEKIGVGGFVSVEGCRKS
jgi:hypothetical protein